MDTKTQLDWTKEQLQTYGRVSRNEALRIYFTRLGARINDLKREGWQIIGEWEKTERGKDYIYKITPSQGELKF